MGYFTLRPKTVQVWACPQLSGYTPVVSQGLCWSDFPLQLKESEDAKGSTTLQTQLGRDGDTSNGALWPVRTPMFTDEPLCFGGTGQAEMK